MNEEVTNETTLNYKYKYVVWVGGVDDYYTTYERAKEHYDEWVAKGYDDVIIQEIGKWNDTIKNCMQLL